MAASSPSWYWLFLYWNPAIALCLLGLVSCYNSWLLVTSTLIDIYCSIIITYSLYPFYIYSISITLIILFHPYYAILCSRLSSLLHQQLLLQHLIFILQLPNPRFELPLQLLLQLLVRLQLLNRPLSSLLLLLQPLLVPLLHLPHLVLLLAL